LRAGDGRSLWADSFDIQGTDVFLVQDKVAQQIVTRLRIQLDPAQQASLNKRYTSSAIAYDFYVRGIYNLDLRGYGDHARSQMEATIDFFNKAIEADPDYALAHAQLAYAYVWMALFVEPTEPRWAVRAREEISRSQALDQQLAEPHVANALLLWSSYEGFQSEAAVRQLLLAQQLDPNVGHTELAAISGHIGLQNLASRELQRALEVDPTSQKNNDLRSILLQLGGKYDEWLAANQKNPDVPDGVWYSLGKGRLDNAEAAIDRRLAQAPDSPELLCQRALLLALRGNLTAAVAKLPAVLSKQPRTHPNYHHITYSIACTYAVARNSGEAVKWLRETAATGFPNYPLFERDSYLDRIRQTPEFVKFMSEQKAQWQQLRQEFGD
jgi:tetratricopeptide (TPR) repeat protein